jgi:tetratricopeptide (TPR) repeat protein
MKICTLMTTLLVAAALLLPAGFAFSQDRMADMKEAMNLVKTHPTFNNRLRLATLEYLQGTDALKANDMAMAVTAMQHSVATLDAGKGQIPESHPVYEVARYGLAYALVQNGKPYDALLVLDQLEKASPDFGKARYLLGATLLQISGEKSQQRAVEVLTKLAQDGQSPYKEWAAHAATRIAFDLSTLVHARGDAAGASKVLSQVTGAIGDSMASDSDEAVKVMFAEGVYLRDAGDVNGALDHLEAAYKVNSNFRLANGVALSGVTSNAYYSAGLQQLSLGGDTAPKLAADMFDGALRTGDSGALDAHHGKAVAYTKAKDFDKASDELKVIVSKDPAYYEKIKKK